MAGKPVKGDTKSMGSLGTNEGSTQAGTYGLPGGESGALQHRIISRKNNSNVGPGSKNPAPITGAESANFGLPMSSEESRKTGKRG